MGLSAPRAFQFQNQLARLDFIDEVPQPSVTAATPKLHLRRARHSCLLPRPTMLRVLKLLDGPINYAHGHWPSTLPRLIDLAVDS